MAFPIDIDELSTTREVGTPDPAGDNNAQAAAILAIEAKLGVNDSEDSDSIDYRVGAIEDTETGFERSISRVDTWVFPDDNIDPTEDILTDKFYAIKAIWYEVDTSGVLVLRNNSSFGSNFYYTPANADLVKEHSTEQYLNISCGDAVDMNTLCSNGTKRLNAITAIVAFCLGEGWTGCEIDFENYQDWTGTHYTNYKTFITELTASLHTNGLKLIVDAPAIWNSATVASDFEWTSRNSQGYYEFKYEDFESIAVDYILPMAYDYQYDLSSGFPNSPLQYAADVLSWAQLKISDHSRIIMGLPSAGYSATTGEYTTTGRTYDYLVAQTGFGKYGRDQLSGEIIWDNGGISYAALDDVSVDLKMRFLEKYSCTRFSLWHCGQNNYGESPTVRLTFS